MEKRHTSIISLVSQYQKIEVNKLSELLKVSSVTIRKDLDLLEEKGFLTRMHGFAVMRDVADMKRRLAIRYETKAVIASAAGAMVAHGETIMIESGSCCALLAACLAQTKRDVTIITNSAFIAAYIRENTAVRVILLGGEYQKESQVMVGPLVRICAREFHVDKLFVGTDGFDPSYGFAGSDLMRTEAMKSMSASANKTIVLTDASKFSEPSVVVQLRFEDIYGVVTDSGIPVAAEALLKEHLVEVVVAGKV